MHGAEARATFRDVDTEMLRVVFVARILRRGSGIVKRYVLVETQFHDAKNRIIENIMRLQTFQNRHLELFLVQKR